MNNQIKELAKQSGINFDGFGTAIATYSNDELQIFAELIIRECARISNESDDTWTGQGAASSDAFMKYFGVKE